MVCVRVCVCGVYVVCGVCMWCVCMWCVCVCGVCVCGVCVCVWCVCVCMWCVVCASCQTAADLLALISRGHDSW